MQQTTNDMKYSTFTRNMKNTEKRVNTRDSIRQTHSSLAVRKR